MTSSEPTRTDVFGCVPYRVRTEGVVEVLLVHNSTEQGYWEFPKGKRDPGERDEDTALRELAEETGLQGKIVSGPLAPFSFQHERDGVLYEKTVTYYLCQVPQGAAVTHAPREVDDHVWLAPRDAEQRATFPHMKAVAQEVVTRFEKKYIPIVKCPLN